MDLLQTDATRIGPLGGCVAPEIAVEPGEVLFPWRVVVGNHATAAYAIDPAHSLPSARLLDRG